MFESSSHSVLDDFSLPQFKAQVLFGNPHLNTLALLLPRRRRSIQQAELRDLPLADADRLRVVLHRQEDQSQPWLILIHGLIGSSESSYMLGTTSKAVLAGWQVARVNMRGCGDTEHLARRLYHSGLSADLRYVLDFVRDLGAQQIVLAGFSMGGNQVLKLLGECSDQVADEVLGAVAVSPAVDVAACAHVTDTKPSLRMYRGRFLRDLKRGIRRRQMFFPEARDLTGLDDVASLRELDEQFTAPDWGFSSADDYYAKASALPVVDRIRVPVLALSSRDDPLVPVASLQPLGESAAVSLHLTDRGGHVSYLGRKFGDPDCRWAENRVLQFAQYLRRT